MEEESAREERDVAQSIQGLNVNPCLVGMGRYRYQIFDTIDTGLRSDGIDTQ